ncbi:hemerythrin domain-containing protein [Vibrio hannami]|uniref:hemerythrin domain-containing protein n=1 Tax=Vibrio hannami TaxID=2717094 RepID=UPI00240F9E81|nr:hemerythrin domain-containing protein [Vibrio hannami]MDG3084873.1 hemerythrin domain-containing protein [Vibrio hannami]
MPTIQNFMTQHHKTCDELLIKAEGKLAIGEWEQFSEDWNEFELETLHHFQLEEDILFPEFETQTGMTGGPTMVMRQEHAQARALMEQMTVAVADKNTDKAMGILESLMILIQQHNMKEEQILYPMSDNHLQNNEEVVAKMENMTRD